MNSQAESTLTISFDLSVAELKHSNPTKLLSSVFPLSLWLNYNSMVEHFHSVHESLG